MNKERRAEVKAAYIAAQHMSNWLFNQSQHDRFKEYREDMREMVDAWDAEAGIIRELSQPVKRVKLQRDELRNDPHAGDTPEECMVDRQRIKQLEFELRDAKRKIRELKKS